MCHGSFRGFQGNFRGSGSQDGFRRFQVIPWGFSNLTVLERFQRRFTGISEVCPRCFNEFHGISERIEEGKVFAAFKDFQKAFREVLVASERLQGVL